MKTILYVLSILVLISCSNEKELEKNYIKPAKVVISGKVINYNLDKNEVYHTLRWLSWIQNVG